MALVGQTIGREISKLERRHEKRNADKDGQRASSYRFVSSFGVISLHIALDIFHLPTFKYDVDNLN